MPTLTSVLLREIFPGTGGFSQYIDEDLQKTCERMMPDYEISEGLKTRGFYSTLNGKPIIIEVKDTGDIKILGCKERLYYTIEWVVREQLKRHLIFK